MDSNDGQTAIINHVFTNFLLHGASAAEDSAKQRMLKLLLWRQDA